MLGYLDNNADRMDYPTYERSGYPISSGPMESFCKQLGRRLKGGGMQWSGANVGPMAAKVSLWAIGEWSKYWSAARTTATIGRCTPLIHPPVSA